MQRKAEISRALFDGNLRGVPAGISCDGQASGAKIAYDQIVRRRRSELWPPIIDRAHGRPVLDEIADQMMSDEPTGPGF